MYLVIDIGGTFIKYGMMSDSGELLSKGKRGIGRSGLQELQDALNAIVDAQDMTQIQGIALSCPGTIDVETGVVYHGGSFPFCMR